MQEKKTALYNLSSIVPIISILNVKKETILTVSEKNLLLSLKILKNHFGFRYDLLTCISGVDLFNQSFRFCVVYELLSISFNSRLRVKIFVNEVTSICSIISIFINADWWEREIFDLYGINFNNHPDLRRILTDYGFEGHPMRKDFSISGYVEVRYDTIKKQIVVEPLELTQEFRYFQFDNNWLN
jgi:NADH/F420H2 dehydrogenase subunit C